MRAIADYSSGIKSPCVAACYYLAISLPLGNSKSAQEDIASVKITPSTIAGIAFLVLLLVVVLKTRAKAGGLPPHEFAYGTALQNCAAIPPAMDQFLSLDVMDPAKIQIQAYVGNQSAKNLTPLIGYVSSQKGRDSDALIVALKRIDQLPNQKQKAIQLVETLCSYKDLLRNESEQDQVIVFVYYGLKQPASVPAGARTKISGLVRQLDNAKQSAEFGTGQCPENYLVGNINVYPLAVENTFWHTVANFSSPKDAPILEIRFMGLKGVFRYMLDEMTSKTGHQFLHVDGESL
jgi:hypothetical protein